MGRRDRGTTVVVASAGRCFKCGIVNTDASPGLQEGIDSRPVIPLWFTG